ncbi:hypothetical protein D3C84_1015460 [compost metagenome]
MLLVSPALLRILGTWSDIRLTSDRPPPAWANTVTASVRSYSPPSSADCSLVSDQPHFCDVLVRPLGADGISTPGATVKGREAPSKFSFWLMKSRFKRKRSPR